MLNNIPLQHVLTYNYLGIIFDSKMTLAPLFAEVKKIVSNKVYILAKLRNNIAVNCAIAIYKQTILPLL